MRCMAFMVKFTHRKSIAVGFDDLGKIRRNSRAYQDSGFFRGEHETTAQHQHSFLAGCVGRLHGLPVPYPGSSTQHSPPPLFDDKATVSDTVDKEPFMADTHAQISAQPPVSESLTAVRPCIKCGATDRYKDGKCRACNKVIGANYRAHRADDIKATQAAYRAKNPDARKASDKVYRTKNAQRLRVNKAASNATWNAANREKKRAASNAWNAAHPELRKISKQNRRARTKSINGQLSKNLAQKLFPLQRGKCPCCGLPLGDGYHLDHIVPLALGGTNTDDNMQLLRKICNLQKSKKHPIDFMQQRGFLL